MPLLTLWTTSALASASAAATTTRSLVESGVGEPEGGVAFCEVECDAPDVAAGGLGLEYMIGGGGGAPTLLSFDAGLPVAESRVELDAERVADAAFLEGWIRNEARRGRGGGGAGGGGGGGDAGGGRKGGLWGLFGGLR